MAEATGISHPVQRVAHDSRDDVVERPLTLAQMRRLDAAEGHGRRRGR